MFVGWGEAWPPTRVRPPRWEDASIAEIAARLADRIRDGLRQGWLDTLPEQALELLWAAGERALVWALAAALAGEHGRREDAEAALERAFAEERGSPAALLLALRAFNRCGAWTPSIRLDLCSERVACAAIEEARRDGEAALASLMRDRFPEPPGDMMALCLGQEVELAPGGPEAEAQRLEWYQEGMLTRWELHYDLARMRLPPLAAGEVAIAELLTTALESVRALASAVAAAASARATSRRSRRSAPRSHSR